MTGVETEQEYSFPPFHRQTDTGIFPFHKKNKSHQRKGADSMKTLSFTKFNEL